LGQEETREGQAREGGREEGDGHLLDPSSFEEVSAAEREPSPFSLDSHQDEVLGESSEDYLTDPARKQSKGKKKEKKKAKEKEKAKDKDKEKEAAKASTKKKKAKAKGKEKAEDTSNEKDRERGGEGSERRENSRLNALGPSEEGFEEGGEIEIEAEMETEVELEGLSYSHEREEGGEGGEPSFPVTEWTCLVLKEFILPFSPFSFVPSFPRQVANRVC